MGAGDVGMINWSEFFYMGGYAFYIWPAYGIALCILLANILVPYGRQKKLMREVKHRLESEKEDASYS
jgi:heme exporter protein D